MTWNARPTSMDLISILRDLPPLAAAGALAGRLVCSPFKDRSPRLEYRCTADVPFPDFADIKETMRLGFTFPAPEIADGRRWGGRTLDFLRSPDTKLVDGEPVPAGNYAPGTITFRGAAVPVLCWRIECGALEGSNLATRLWFLLFPHADFLRASPAGELEVALEMALGSTAVIGEIGGGKTPSGEEARRMAECFLSLDDYEEVMEGEVVTYRPRAD